MILIFKEIGSSVSLLVICMMIFSLLGMELFGHKVKYDDFGDVLIDEEMNDKG